MMKKSFVYLIIVIIALVLAISIIQAEKKGTFASNKTQGKKVPFQLRIISFKMASAEENGAKVEMRISEQDNYREAIRWLKATVGGEEAQSNIEGRAYYILGQLNFKLRRWDRARYYLELASDIYQILGDYTQYYIAETYYNSRDFPRAIIIYEELLKQYPDSIWAPSSQLKIAFGYFLLEDFESSEKAFRKLITTYPKSKESDRAWLGLGSSLEEEGRIKEAIDVYRELEFKFPLSAYVNIARSHLAQLTSEYRITPRLPTADELYERIETYYEAGRCQSAVEDIKQFLSLYPDSPHSDDAAFLRAMCNYKVKNYKWAGMFFQQVIEDENSSEEYVAQARLYLGDIERTNGNLEKAIKLYGEVINYHPKLHYAVEAEYHLAEIRSWQKEDELAISLYQKLVENHPESWLADDSLWNIGWLSYLGDNYERSFEAFHKLTSDYPSSNRIVEALYWEGKSAEKLEKWEKAVSAYQKLIRKYAYTYYGYRAQERVGYLEIRNVQELWQRTGEDKQSEGEIVDDKEEIYTPQFAEHLSKGEELTALTFYDEAAKEFELALEEVAEDTKLALKLADTYSKDNDHHKALKVLWKYFPRYLNGEWAPDIPGEIWSIAYPLDYWELVERYSQDRNLPPFLVIALIREESTFYPNAQSWADARGLMQVIPSTGEWIAEKIEMDGYNHGRLYEPELNIMLGSWYLSYLMNRFDANLFLVLAGYNGGPNRVQRWWDNKNSSDIDLFVETIPLDETRNYVKKVLRSYNQYKRIYGNSEEELGKSR